MHGIIIEGVREKGTARELERERDRECNTLRQRPAGWAASVMKDTRQGRSIAATRHAPCALAHAFVKPAAGSRRDVGFGFA